MWNRVERCSFKNSSRLRFGADTDLIGTRTIRNVLQIFLLTETERRSHKRVSPINGSVSDKWIHQLRLGEKGTAMSEHNGEFVGLDRSVFLILLAWVIVNALELRLEVSASEILSILSKVF